MNNRKIWLWFRLLIFSCAIGYVLVRLTLNKINSGSECEEEKKMAFNGTVKEIVLDSSNLAQKFIILTNGEKILPPFTYGLWNEVSVGDSIIKRPKTLNYVIYKSKGLHEKTLRWDCLCK